MPITVTPAGSISLCRTNLESDYKNTLTQQFEESHRLSAEIMKQLDSLKFNNTNL